MKTSSVVRNHIALHVQSLGGLRIHADLLGMGYTNSPGWISGGRFLLELPAKDGPQGLPSRLEIIENHEVRERGWSIREVGKAGSRRYVLALKAKDPEFVAGGLRLVGFEQTGNLFVDDNGVTVEIEKGNDARWHAGLAFETADQMMAFAQQAPLPYQKPLLAAFGNANKVSGTVLANFDGGMTIEGCYGPDGFVGHRPPSMVGQINKKPIPPANPPGHRRPTLLPARVGFHSRDN